ncbi:MAG: hypothetical protein IKE43_05425 [Coriobacteriales bacterium]|nr:hypothetical protein [Coriobacteriales bacterium]
MPRQESGNTPRLLVIDELGRLELLRDGGLTEAVKCLEDGPIPLRQHALVVVRSDLLGIAEKRFAHVWPVRQPIYPDADGIKAVISSFDRNMCQENRPHGTKSLFTTSKPPAKRTPSRPDKLFLIVHGDVGKDSVCTTLPMSPCAIRMTPLQTFKSCSRARKFPKHGYTNAFE